MEALIAEEIGEQGVIAKVRTRLDDIFSSRDLLVQQVYLNQFVENRIEQLGPLFAHREINLSVRLKASAPIAMPLDPLKKVIDGLIRNAVENTPDGGKIEVLVHGRGKGWNSLSRIRESVYPRKPSEEYLMAFLPPGHFELLV